MTSEVETLTDVEQEVKSEVEISKDIEPVENIEKQSDNMPRFADDLRTKKSENIFEKKMGNIVRPDNYKDDFDIPFKPGDDFDIP